MNPRLARLLTRLYPRAWRARYGTEFAALLEMGRGDFRTLVNSVYSALTEHIFPTGGRKMNEKDTSFISIVKHPSAFLPIAMSLVALAMVLGSIGLYGVVHDTDEGAVAHLWQLLMAGQLPIILLFAIKWLPRAPRQTLPVLALQAVAALASMSPVFFLGL